MRLMGIDYGTKRVGIALSDEGNTFALPKTVIENTEQSELYAAIARMVSEYGVTEIVIGESKDLKGVPNPVMADITKLKTLLEEGLKLPVYLEPEFFSSLEAERIQGKTGSLDASAAAIVLKSFMTKRAHTVKANPPPRPLVPYDAFAAVEMRMGKILHAERVPATDKLLRLEVDFGEERGPRQVVSGISAYFPEPRELAGRMHLFVTNLEPRMIKGLKSEAMIVAVGDGETFSLLSAKDGVPPGSSAR